MEGAHGDETQIKRLRRRRDHTERVLHGEESDGDTDIVEGKDEAIGSKRLCVCMCERERERWGGEGVRRLKRNVEKKEKNEGEGVRRLK